MDIASDMATFRDNAIADRNFEIARNMLLDGEPVEKIVRYTGLTADEVEDLRKQLVQ